MGQMSGDTVHFDIVDKDGNMVSATPSGGWLHGSPVVPELGFPVGTRGQICWLEEGQPVLAGAGQAAAHHADARRSPIATASRTCAGARRVATSRSSGSPRCSCATSIAA
jgi:gamma-glutamyltranspeptidase